MSTFLTFNQWLNEAQVPYDIERCRLDKMKWTLNDKLRVKFESDNDDVEDAAVYVAEDRDRNLVYTFMSWSSSGDLHIHLNENKKPIFKYTYIPKDIHQFNQDCQIILGFKIKN